MEKARDGVIRDVRCELQTFLYMACVYLGITEAKKPTTHECAVPLDPGPCSSALPRWYYDEKQQHCIQFQYSGKYLSISSSHVNLQCCHLSVKLIIASAPKI